jgi:hypothetical protein
MDSSRVECIQSDFVHCTNQLPYGPTGGEHRANGKDIEAIRWLG